MAVQITGWFPRLNATVAAPAMHATATLNPPTLSEVASVAINAPAMTATAVLERPVVSLNVAVVAPRMVASATMSAPTVLAGIVVAAPAMHATATLNAPTVAASRFLSVSAPAMTAAAAMATPAVTQAVGVAITATPMAATAVLKTPTVAASTNVAVSAPAMTATAAAHVPTVSASVSITAPAMTATAAAKTPAVSVNAAVSAPAMTATAAAKTPTVVASTNVSVSAPKMTATAAMNVPTVAVSVPFPTFDAIGTGAVHLSGAVITPTLSHTATAGAEVLLFLVNSTGGTPPPVQYGSLSMTAVGNVSDAEGAELYCYKLSDAPSGPQTITVGSSGSSTFAANSISFTGTTSVGTPVTTSGVASQAVTCGTNQTIVQVFEDLIGAGIGLPITAISGGIGEWSQTASSGAMTISTATASTTFTETDGESGAISASMAVVLS